MGQELHKEPGLSKQVGRKNGFQSLHGPTLKRSEAVSNFSSGDNCQTFVGATQRYPSLEIMVLQPSEMLFLISIFQDLIKTVLPSKTIKNERILETLMFQANSGMYRVHDSYLEACQERLQKQDSKFSEWESFDCTFQLLFLKKNKKHDTPVKTLRISIQKKVCQYGQHYNQ